jgi:hypothetical protein
MRPRDAAACRTGRRAPRTILAMDVTVVPQVAVLAGAGIVAGLWLLVRGMRGYGTAIRIGDTGTSRIASLAAGEVRINGVIEPAEISLVSPLQSTPCVYYRAIVDESDGRSDVWADSEERAVGFRVRDASGDVRVFPHGAHWDAPIVLDDRTDAFGVEPPALRLRTGSGFTVAESDRDQAIARLLSVEVREPADGHPLLRGGGGIRGGRGRRRYREARLAAGDAVTIVGRAMPFGDLRDPAEADLALGSELAADDPEVAGNIAEARAAGLLVGTPEEAWGNAAIPGFGIGRPVRPPDLDPAAAALPIASAEEAVRAERTFAIAPETLVLASAPDVPLLIAHGHAGAAAERHQDRFLVGLLGALLAIGSAMAFAIMLGGGFGS